MPAGRQRDRTPYLHIVHQPDPATVYPASVRLIAVVASTLGILLLVFSGLTFFLDADTARVIPIIELFFGISLLSYGLTHIRNTTPELIIDPLGILLPGIGRIAWQEIESVQIEKVRGQKWIRINLVDLRSVAARAGGVFRATSLLATALGVAPLAITAIKVLPDTVEDVVAVMQSYCPTLRWLRM